MESIPQMQPIQCLPSPRKQSSKSLQVVLALEEPFSAPPRLFREAASIAAVARSWGSGLSCAVLRCPGRNGWCQEAVKQREHFCRARTSTDSTGRASQTHPCILVAPLDFSNCWVCRTASRWLGAWPVRRGDRTISLQTDDLRQILTGMDRKMFLCPESLIGGRG